MRFEKFTQAHIPAAMELQKKNFEAERCFVPALPENTVIPDELQYFAETGLGVAAMDGDRLLGYLCFCEPWHGAFDMYDGLGAFSPLIAHAAEREQSGRLYQDMVEWLGSLLAEKDIVCAGICLYAHDEAAKAGLFEYGFGMRCKDRIREITGNESKTCQSSGLSFEELPVCRFPEISDLRASLNAHLQESPCFMQSTEDEFREWLKKVEAGDRRTFIAKKDGKTVAYIDIMDDGENFVGDHPEMKSIHGAYCLPEYRGQGIYGALLLHVSDLLYKEGNRFLGVDHESYNPAANRFWNKYFSEYTNSVTRRIETWSMKK